MKFGALIFLLAFAGAAQTRLRPCGSSSATASSPAVADIGSPSARLRSPANRRPPLHPSKSCWCGTVDASSLTAAALSQEVLILTGLTGNFRFEYVLIQEARQFLSDSVSSLAVAASRPNTDGEIVPSFVLKSDAAPENFAWARPQPPVLNGTYDLVLNFVGSSPLGIGGVPNFTSGSVNWEVCGYPAS